MGQKVNPHGLRVGVIKDWDSRWFAQGKNFSDSLVEDYKIRKFLIEDLKKEQEKKASKKSEDTEEKIVVDYDISKVEIERAANNVRVIVYTAKPGAVIGKNGENVDQLKARIQKLTKSKLFLDIKEIKKPEKDAQLVAESIANQLENRASFRRAMKKSMQATMKAGALGIKASVGGRLGGADIARSEFYAEGTIPLQTLRADIDYGFAEADTTYGKLGIKVWIYKGEVLPQKKAKEGSGK